MQLDIIQALNAGDERTNKNGKPYVAATAEARGVKFVLNGKEVVAPYVRVNILTQGGLVDAANYKPDARLTSTLNTLGSVDIGANEATPEAVRAAEALVAKLKAACKK